MPSAEAGSDVVQRDLLAVLSWTFVCAPIAVETRLSVRMNESEKRRAQGAR